MILRSPLSIPPNPLAGPRKIGNDTDYIELDSANGQINTAGTASPLAIQNLATDIWVPPAGGGSEYTPGLFNGPEASNRTIVNTLCYMIPFTTPIQLEIDQLVIMLAAGADGKVARCGIYNRTGDERLAQSAQFTVAIADQGLITLEVPYTFNSGVYYLALATDGNITIDGSLLSGCYVVTTRFGGGHLFPSCYGTLAFSYSAGGDLPSDATPTGFPANSFPPRICVRPVA